MKYFLSFILYFNCIYASSQTCILIISKNDTITIGADSRVTIDGYFLSPTGKKDTSIYLQSCKIRQEKNVFYTSYGQYANIIMDYGGKSLKKQNTFKDTIYFNTNIVKKKLEDSLEFIRNNNPLLYLTNYNGVFSKIIFVWFFNNIPKAHGFSFQTINNPNDKVKIKITSELIILHNKNRILPLGEYQAIENIWNTPEFWTNKSIEAGIRQLFDIQIKATPKIVGYPISIIELTKNSNRWLEKGICR